MSMVLICLTTMVNGMEQRTMHRNSLWSIVLIYLMTMLLNRPKSMILTVEQSDEQDVEQDSEMFDNRT